MRPMSWYKARSNSSRSYDLRRAAIFAVFFATLAPARTYAADDSGIFVMKIDGTEERKVAEVVGFSRHMSPRWSHDGSRLAFEAYEGPDSSRKFFVVNVDGTNLQEVGEHGSPDWSPDDQQLVFHHLGGTLRAG